MNEKEFEVLLSKAPDDPREHREWAERMTRIQLAMYVDGKATCEQCGYTYTSVDDMIRCDPKRGYGKPDKMTFVCSSCWKKYENSHKTKSEISKD